jgi:hypothetical protein
MTTAYTLLAGFAKGNFFRSGVDVRSVGCILVSTTTKGVTVYEDAFLDTWMEDRLGGGGVDPYDDDLYWLNQAEADDYRNEWNYSDDLEDD